MSNDARLPAHGDLSAEEFRRRGYEIIDWIADFLDHVGDRPVLSQASPGDLLAQVSPHGPEDPVAWETLLEDLDTVVMPGVTHWNHPRFLAYFANTASVPGILGAMVATALNPNGMLWRTSPSATELEQRVAGWVARWVGLPDDLFGMINDTASVSSLVSIAAAREVAPGYRRASGLRSLDQPLRLYVSEQAHSSIEKAALVLGLGHEAVVKIRTRPDYSLDPDHLAAAIADDRSAGALPFCVVATVGTTSTTSVDPVDCIADLCEREGLWLHVDAAYAGPAAMLDELRPLFAGWERADSVVLNPHKWLFTPMCSSLLYTRRPDALREAFSLVPEYLRTDVGTGDAAPGTGLPPDYMNYGVQLGRPFRSLTLWFVLSTYGRRGLERRLRDHIEVTSAMAKWVDEHPDFERLAPTPFSVVCFRYRPGAGVGASDGTQLNEVDEDPHAAANEAIMAAVNANGHTFLSHTRLRGRLALRFAIGNLRTTEADVRSAWEEVLRAAC
jgi:aromatic-L-amino-acid decarboxylase